ncbi:hypothetical protein GQX73_g4627 [Xylaria multiplex]|uniref:Uncharacterized protein n=1 Tax=Xylaria multiplex TaxID=323545 RepID=A0A7C8N852_9PEZI|nr:hypothetical protein GQX73_g4627 [Xylaria multiplex]
MSTFKLYDIVPDLGDFVPSNAAPAYVGLLVGLVLCLRLQVRVPSRQCHLPTPSPGINDMKGIKATLLRRQPLRSLFVRFPSPYILHQSSPFLAIALFALQSRSHISHTNINGMATPVISGITRTNLGPLTTNTWTYTCTEVIQQCSDCNVGWAAQTCVDGVVSDNQACWPPRATNVPVTSGALNAWGVYSPGIECPSGYTSIAAAIHGGSADFDFQFPLTAGETAVGCCPIGGFTATRDVFNSQTCTQLEPTTSFLVGSCGTAGPTFTPFSVGGTLDSKTYTSFAVHAPLLQLVYQASDLPETGTTKTGSSGSSSSTGSSNGGTLPPTSRPNGENGQSGTSSGLSPGAAAGIAVGAILGVLLITAAAFCLWRVGRRRRLLLQQHQQQHAKASSPRDDAEFFASEFKLYWPPAVLAPPVQDNSFAYSVAVPSGIVEVNPTHPAELASNTLPSELANSSRPFELESSPRMR